MASQYEAAVASLGVGPDEPVVTLHVREAGFDAGRVSQSFRNARIGNCLSAIRALAAEGFRVIRIGDQSMTRLPDLGPNVLDAAYAPTIAQSQMTGAIVEACAIMRSEFYIGMASGPYIIALAVRTPTLLLNTPLTWGACSPNPEDLVVFRKYRITGSVQPLSFAEVGCHSVFDQIEDFGAARLVIEIEENSPELIEAAIAEMRLRTALDRNGTQLEVVTDTLFRQRVAELQSARHAFVQSREMAGLFDPRLRERVMIAFGAPRVRLSAMSLIDNPRFLE